MKDTKKSDKPKIRKKEFEVKLLSENAILPKKAVRGAIGYDLCIPSDVRVPARSRVAIPLDIAINLPFGVEAKIEPRSGCTLRGIEGYGQRTVVTGKILGLFPQKEVTSGKMYFDADVCVSKVDPNYTDNIHVIVVNRDESFLIRKGSRIAQLTFYQTIAPFFKQVDELTCESRGGGLGHTGLDRLRGIRGSVAKMPMKESADETTPELKPNDGDKTEKEHINSQTDISNDVVDNSELVSNDEDTDTEYGVHI